MCSDSKQNCYRKRRHNRIAKNNPPTIEQRKHRSHYTPLFCFNNYTLFRLNVHFFFAFLLRGRTKLKFKKIILKRENKKMKMKKKFVANVTATFVSYKSFLLLWVGARGLFLMTTHFRRLCARRSFEQERSLRSERTGSLR